jgi:hypothetical protein
VIPSFPDSALPPSRVHAGIFAQIDSSEFGGGGMVCGSVYHIYILDRDQAPDSASDSGKGLAALGLGFRDGCADAPGVTPYQVIRGLPEGYLGENQGIMGGQGAGYAGIGVSMGLTGWVRYVLVGYSNLGASKWLRTKNQSFT